jgi:lipopolysaccharide export system permease protein
MQFLWKWVDELVGKGLEWQVVAELFFYASLSVVPLAIPMAVLLSSLMTFGNLAEHYELAALKSSGMSLMKIMRPLILLALMTMIGAFVFANYVLPYTNLKMYSTLFDIRQQKPALNIKEGIFYNEIDGYSIRIRKISSDKVNLEDVMIYDHTDNMGNTMLTVAEHGKMFMTEDKRYLVIELHNGMSYREEWSQPNSATTRPFMRLGFKDQLLRLDLSGFKMQRTQEDLFKDNHQMLNGEQLLDYIDTMQQEIQEDIANFYPSVQSAYFTRSRTYWDLHDSLKTVPVKGDFLSTFSKDERNRIFENALNSARNCKATAESKVNELEAEEKTIVRFEIEFWRKYALSFACLLMFFIGAPLGAIIRKGGLGMPVVFSVIFFILFWAVSITFEKLSLKSAVPPYIGMWMGCVVFIPIAIILTRKATADANLFDVDSYVSVIRNFFTQKRKKA